MAILRRTLAAAALAAGLVVFVAVPASAHAEVVSTSPQSGSTVNGQLTEVSVTFDEAVVLVPHAMRMTTDMGIPVNLETARLSAAGKVLSAQIQDHLAAGSYAVAWRVQADDGHLESSTFSFAVAASGAAQHSTTSVPSGPPPSAPGEPLWPVFVAAGLALAGGVGAGVAVRRGLRLAAAHAALSDHHGTSPPERESLRLPM